MSEDKVSNLHPKYKEQQEKRDKIADVRGGTLSVRAKGREYLPLNPQELDSTYKKRLQTSTFFNKYKKTEEMMTGLVFQTEIDTSAVNPSLKPLLENIDNKGNHFNIVARQVLEKQFDGFSIILVDSPNNQAEDKEQEKQLGIRPYWVVYEASNLINWDYAINPTSKATELSLAVFKEVNYVRTGSFSFEKVTTYRVWFLNERHQPVWEVYREIEKDGEKILEKQAEGVIERFNKLPIVIIGNVLDNPLLLDLALLNIKHYQKESNFDNLEFQAGVPLFYTKGYKGAEEDLPVGADVHYRLSTEGDIGWAQLDASGFESLRQSLKELVTQMETLGLSQLADKTAKVDLTATEALLNNIGETAELKTRAELLKDGLELALGLMAEYLGKGEDAGGEIVLGTAWRKDDQAQTVNIEGVSGADPTSTELIN